MIHTGIRVAIAILALVVSTETLAQQAPVVRIEATPDTVEVGQSIDLRVTVLVPSWFARPPVYPDFELPNTITRLPTDSSFPTSERIAGDTWSGIVRDYRIYPLTGATYRLSGEIIDIAYANPGAGPVEQTVAVPEVGFRATVPAGAEVLDPYIAGRSMTLALSIDGDTGDLKAGDAVVLTYSAELDGLPAIFIPSFVPRLGQPGLSVYADQPVIEDSEPARRSESVTLVFDAGGEFAVPAVAIDYWNTDTASIGTARADGIVLSVAGPAATPADGEEESPEINWAQIGSIFLFGLVAITVLRRLWPAARSYMVAAEAKKRASEDYAFDRLQEVLRTGQSGDTYRALLAWTGRLEPPMDSREFARRFGDESLNAGLESLRNGMFGSGPASVDVRGLSSGLHAARRRYQRQVQRPDSHALLSLNP